MTISRFVVRADSRLKGFNSILPVESWLQMSPSQVKHQVRTLCDGVKYRIHVTFYLDLRER